MHIQYKLDLKKMSGMQTKIIEIKDKQAKILKLDNPEVQHIIMKFQENQDTSMGLFITFHFYSEDLTLENAKAISAPLLNNIINLLVYKLLVSISDPKINAYDTVDGSMHASGSITLYNLEHYELPEIDYSWLENNIDSSNLSEILQTSGRFQMYKSILLVENVTSRFLLLYSLLYEMKKNQNGIDRYIMRKEPKVKMIKSKNKNKKGSNLETAYTWWRNQSQHMQKDTSINEITQNYSQLIDGLQLIVFQAILGSLQLPYNNSR
ncbi:hypothetical protein [Trichococcus shcherbakoviae]|uniref:Uncharacterized protein n=1 Tax=Trichococcus shcherbakoviae TaxID=2094020 RepID=A0A383TCQ4_9LACT|nr:hypothetical protein [Trichococcus shcherbakoviae]SYZ77251.1 Hypothetical protein TART1_0013 [Trichococcus shcherbakoviae]